MADEWLRASSTYRAIYRKGIFLGFAKGFTKHCPEEPDQLRIICHQEWLLYLGKEWLGLPPADARTRIEAIVDESKLEKLAEQLADDGLDVATWDDLLALADFPSTARAALR